MRCWGPAAPAFAEKSVFQLFFFFPPLDRLGKNARTCRRGASRPGNFWNACFSKQNATKSSAVAAHIGATKANMNMAFCLPKPPLRLWRRLPPAANTFPPMMFLNWERASRGRLSFALTFPLLNVRCKRVAGRCPIHHRLRQIDRNEISDEPSSRARNNAGSRFLPHGCLAKTRVNVASSCRIARPITVFTAGVHTRSTFSFSGREPPVIEISNQ